MDPIIYEFTRLGSMTYPTYEDYLESIPEKIRVANEFLKLIQKIETETTNMNILKKCGKTKRLVQSLIINLKGHLIREK